MKTFVLFLVVLVSSSAFAWPNLRQTEENPQPAENDDLSDETFDQEMERCERHLKCEVTDDGIAKRQVEDDEENKAACERLFNEAEDEVKEEAKRNLGDEEEEKERDELVAELESCKSENDRVDCDGGSKPETRFLRRMLRNLEGEDCLKAVRKAKKLRGGEKGCRCESKESESQGEDKDRQGSGDRKGRPRPGGNKDNLDDEVKRLLRLLEKK